MRTIPGFAQWESTERHLASRARDIVAHPSGIFQTHWSQGLAETLTPPDVQASRLDLKTHGEVRCPGHLRAPSSDTSWSIRALCLPERPESLIREERCPGV